MSDLDYVDDFTAFSMKAAQALARDFQTVLIKATGSGALPDVTEEAQMIFFLKVGEGVQGILSAIKAGLNDARH